MPSFESYESNLTTRLAELRNGDRAYELHCNAILETLPYEALDAPEATPQRILDVGCGLGFLSVRMANFPEVEVVGIDPSEKAIELAKAEHQAAPNVKFYAASAEEFAAQMLELGIPSFERAIVNMVLHSIDDDAVTSILGAVRESLAPHGVLTLVIPDRYWLMQKLIEKAQAEHMEREAGLAWVENQLTLPSVDLRIGIRSQPAYEEPITIYNRTLSDYAQLVLSSGFGLRLRQIDPATDELIRSFPPTAFWEWDDHTSGYDLAGRDRHIVMTKLLERPPAEDVGLELSIS